MYMQMRDVSVPKVHNQLIAMLSLRSTAAAFLAAALLLVVYWQTRNFVLHGQFLLSTTTEVTISRFIATDTLAEALSINRDEARLIILEAEDRMAYSFGVMRQYPLSFMRVTIRGIERAMLGTEVGTWMQVLFDQPYQSSGLLTVLVRGEIRSVLEAMLVRMQSGQNPIEVLLLVWGVLSAVILYVLVTLGTVRAFRSELPEVRSL